MSKYLVVSYDNHDSADNINVICIDGSYEEAAELGYETAVEIVQNSSTIMQSLCEEASQRYEVNSPEYFDFLDELIEDNTCFDIYQLKEDTPIADLNKNINPFNWVSILEEYKLRGEN